MTVIDFSDKELYIDWVDEFTRAYYDPEIRYIFLRGGAGAGKSVTIAQILTQNLDEYKIMGVRKVYETCKDSIHAEFCDFIDKGGLKAHGWSYVDRPAEVRYMGKEAVIYKGIQHEKDREKLKSVQGIDQVRIEEGTELTKDDVEQIDLRVRSGKNNKIIISYNPIDSKHWLKTEVEDKRENRKDQSVLISKGPYDNRFLPASYLQRLENMKLTNPEYYKIYVKNEWGQGMKGKIFTKYNVFDFDIVPDVMGMDFGYNDPTTLMYLKVEDKGSKISDDEGREIAVKDLYIQEKLFKTQLTGTQIVEELKRLNVPTDVLIVADNARPELIQTISDAGYWIVACDKGKGSIQGGISLLKEFILHINGKNAVKEWGKYCWALDKNGEPTDVPVDADNHTIDGARYAATKQRQSQTELSLYIG